MSLLCPVANVRQPRAVVVWAPLKDEVGQLEAALAKLQTRRAAAAPTAQILVVDADILMHQLDLLERAVASGAVALHVPASGAHRAGASRSGPGPDVALNPRPAALTVICLRSSAVQLLDERKKGDDRDNRQARKVIRFLERTLRQQRWMRRGCRLEAAWCVSDSARPVGITRPSSPSPYLHVHSQAPPTDQPLAVAVWLPNSAEALATRLAATPEDGADGPTAPAVRLWSMSAVPSLMAAEQQGLPVPWQPIGASELASAVAAAEAAAGTRPAAAHGERPTRGRGAPTKTGARARRGRGRDRTTVAVT